MDEFGRVGFPVELALVTPSLDRSVCRQRRKCATLFIHSSDINHRAFMPCFSDIFNPQSDPVYRTQ